MRIPSAFAAEANKKITDLSDENRRLREALRQISQMEGADEMTDYQFAAAALKIATEALDRAAKRGPDERQ